MTHNYVFVLLLCLFFVSQIECKSFQRCDLVQELKRHFPSDQLRDWLCLIEAESTSRTDQIGGPNKDGSREYGLFQISDRYWCSTGSQPGKDCNVRCSDLITDDITIAATCAKKIYARHGFKAWYGWTNKCKGKTLPDITRC